MRSQKISRTPLFLENLEERAVPATVTLVNGGLTVLGSSASETINISQTGSTLSVDGRTFNAADVRLISVDAGEGNDTVTISQTVTATAYIFGAGGDDRLTGGGGRNYIYGGLGNDTIAGGNGQDTVYGGLGTNSISGSASDSITAGHAFATASASAAAQQIVQLVNQQRAAIGLAPLQISGQLTAAAETHSQAMAGMASAIGYSAAMAHTLNGVAQPTLASRAAAVGFEYRTLGENIAYGFASPQSVMTAWMNSVGHRSNILNSMFTHIGVAVAYTPEGMPYYTQEFGTPATYNPTGPAPVTGANTTTTVPPTTTTTPPTTTTTPPTTTTTPPTTTTTPPTTTTTPPTTNTTPVGFNGGSAKAGQVYATGTNGGTTATVTVFDMSTGAAKFQLQPYGTGFRGAVRVAVGDVNGDGRQDVIVAPGSGTNPLVKVYDSASGAMIRSFYAYDTRWTGGVFVAAGDTNGDGKAEIAVSADKGGTSYVRVFDGRTGAATRLITAYSGYYGGVRVAMGDVNGDGKADIVTTPGSGLAGAPVKVFNGVNGALLSTFAAYDSTWKGGAFVAVGDVNGDGKADIVTGAESGGVAQVKVFSGANRALLASFVTDSGFAGGVRVAVRDVTGDGKAEIIAAQGQGGRNVRLYSGTGVSLATFQAGDSTNLTGVYVG